MRCLLVQEEMAAHADTDAASQAEGPSNSLAAEEEEQQGMSASVEASQVTTDSQLTGNESMVLL